MSQRLTDSRLANVGANTIHEAFLTYRHEFQAITRRARKRFVEQDWHNMAADAAERLDLYRRIISLVEAAVRDLLGDRVIDKLVWASMKAVYSGLIADHDVWELAETFFNSVTRRIFTTVGVDPQIEFVSTDFETPPTRARAPVYRTYQPAKTTAELIHRILLDYQVEASFRDCHSDAALVADRIEGELRSIDLSQKVDRIEMIKPIFYRGMGAYLIGRVFSDSHLIPLALSLMHTPDGVTVDAVLLDESSISILFSFAHSYFHVESERPYDLLQFLKSLMPRKRTAEIYISLGYGKHGKTELYRDILSHLAYSDDNFEIARGQRGMVMLVFTMPGYDMVFKVIKDRFNYPKGSTRKDVMAKYDLVYRHDRAGRLVDAQLFEFLKFDRDHFSAELLAEMAREAPQTVELTEQHVIIAHAYVERRVTPLDVYLCEASEEAACSAVLDYGQAIKDMASCNIFPGDMLLKNFGVTRHGRVVFYDYDELCLLTDCRFRQLPPAADYEDELNPEPWFLVNDNDIFPEEFPRFLGLSRPLREQLQTIHGDLFSVDYWRNAQENIRAGILTHIFPYRQEQRIH
jgi:isocitrate dehydrogenase kinase/phosphatase